MSKELAKSSWGYMITDDIYQNAADSIECDIERKIFEYTFKGLKLVNHNLLFALPQILAYCEQMATYQKLMDAVSDNYLTLGQKDNDVVDPRLKQAVICLNAAMNIATRNGFTLKARAVMQAGPEAEKPIKKKGKYNFDE